MGGWSDFRPKEWLSVGFGSRASTSDSPNDTWKCRQGSTLGLGKGSETGIKTGTGRRRSRIGECGSRITCEYMDDGVFIEPRRLGKAGRKGRWKIGR